MRYYLLKVHGNERILAGFENLFHADRAFVEDTAFNSVAVWVEECGHYVCNSGDFETSGELDVLIDRSFDIVTQSDSFESDEYQRYSAVLERLLRELTA